MAKKEISLKKKSSSGSISLKEKPVTTYTKPGLGNANLVNDTALAYQPLYANPISLLTSSKKGLAAKAAIDFLNLSGFSQEQFQETFKTTVKTIQNYDRQELKLDASLSEKLLKSFALFEKGVTLFGSAAAFYDWLNVSAYGLGNQIPFEMMDTITGIGLIEEELIRLEYGDLA